MLLQQIDKLSIISFSTGLQWDCLNLLRELPSASIDFVFTDHRTWSIINRGMGARLQMTTTMHG